MVAFDRSKVVFEVYNNPDENRIVIEYLTLLHGLYGLYKDDRIVICKDEQLRGLCREMHTRVTQKKNLFCWGLFTFIALRWWCSFCYLLFSNYARKKKSNLPSYHTF